MWHVTVTCPSHATEQPHLHITCQGQFSAKTHNLWRGEINSDLESMLSRKTALDWCLTAIDWCLSPHASLSSSSTWHLSTSGNILTFVMLRIFIISLLSFVGRVCQNKSAFLSVLSFAISAMMIHSNDLINQAKISLFLLISHLGFLN